MCRLEPADVEVKMGPFGVHLGRRCLASGVHLLRVLANLGSK